MRDINHIGEVIKGSNFPTGRNQTKCAVLWVISLADDIIANDLLWSVMRTSDPISVERWPLNDCLHECKNVGEIFFYVLRCFTRLTALCPGLPGWAGTRKVKPIWILMEQETVSGSGIIWAICKSAPRSRQITTPAPHHSVFYRPDALPAAQPTASKHWRHCFKMLKRENYNKKNMKMW